MPIVADRNGLAKIQASFSGLRPQLIAAMTRAVKGELREEFKTGVDPDGTAWTQTVKGKPAMISRKLPNAFKGQAVPGGIKFTGKTTRDLLAALHSGHIFSVRKVLANKQFLSFTKKGRLVSHRRIFNKKGDVKRGAYQRFVAAHSVGPRTLPPRPIYPEGAMPPRWDAALTEATVKTLKGWAERAEK